MFLDENVLRVVGIDKFADPFVVGGHGNRPFSIRAEPKYRRALINNLYSKIRNSRSDGVAYDLPIRMAPLEGSHRRIKYAACQTL